MMLRADLSLLYQPDILLCFFYTKPCPCLVHAVDPEKFHLGMGQCSKYFQHTGQEFIPGLVAHYGKLRDMPEFWPGHEVFPCPACGPSLEIFDL